MVGSTLIVVVLGRLDVVVLGRLVVVVLGRLVVVVLGRLVVVVVVVVEKSPSSSSIPKHKKDR